jgi:hypothetical protein
LYVGKPRFLFTLKDEEDYEKLVEEKRKKRRRT